MTYLYRAFCPTCNITCKEASSNTFMDRFFLPSNCNRCGEYKPWLVQYGCWVRNVKFKWLSPKTWRSEYTWMERD